MADAPPAPPSPPSFRDILPTLIISGACPYLTYQLMTTYEPAASKVVALAISGVFPAVHSVAGLVRRRYLDIVGIIVLVGIAVSIVATFVNGDPKLLLIRESFVTGALGIVAVTSFAWPRPLMFYMARQFSAGEQSPERIRQFDELWERPPARRTFRILTAWWAIGWLCEFALRVVMVETLTIPQVLAISPIVFTAINVGLFAATFAYVRWVRRRAQRPPGGS